MRANAAVFVKKTRQIAVKEYAKNAAKLFSTEPFSTALSTGNVITKHCET